MTSTNPEPITLACLRTAELGVQGVGFRPFVHALATRLELTGLVGNDSAGVLIEVEGRQAVSEFRDALERETPPLA